MAKRRNRNSASFLVRNFLRSVPCIFELDYGAIDARRFKKYRSSVLVVITPAATAANK